jgi:hypothetical protein
VIPVSAMDSQSSLSQRLSNFNLCGTIFLCAILSYTTHDPNPTVFSDWFPFHQNLFFLSIVCMVDFVLSPKFFMVTNYSSFTLVFTYKQKIMIKVYFMIMHTFESIFYDKGCNI